MLIKVMESSQIVGNQINQILQLVCSKRWFNYSRSYVCIATTALTTVNLFVETKFSCGMGLYFSMRSIYGERLMVCFVCKYIHHGHTDNHIHVNPAICVM